MPSLFGGIAKKILGLGETYLYSEIIPLVSGKDYPKSLSLYIKTNGSGTFNIKAAIYNGFALTDYLVIKGVGGTTDFAFGTSLAFSIRDQDWWIDAIGGLKFMFERLSGTGEIEFSNAYIYPNY